MNPKQEDTTANQMLNGLDGRHGWFLCSMSRLQHGRPTEQLGSSARPEISSAKTMMDIGTRRIFTEEHDIFRQSVRRFYQEEVVPYHSE